MKNRIVYFTIAIIFIATSCSTKNNTRATRSYHQMCTLYNVGFNAETAYEEGIKKINEAHKDNFTQDIPLFCISNHDNTNAASSQMQRTIDKCRKAIKKHSITKKPKRDKNRWKDPKYQYFYKQEEYVNGVKQAWILLGKAELHKGDFLGAASTFAYIQRHYPSDNAIVCEARIWQARAYAEMDWIYEAQEAFDKIKENDVNRKLNLDYAETKAYLYLKTGEPNKAIPYLELSLKKERNATMKGRISYLLGQILYNNTQNDKAAEYFKLAIKHAQSYPMEFNARLMMHQCAKSDAKGIKSSMKGLKKMLKNANNKDKQSQIYYTMGNIYMSVKDTTKALKSYELGSKDTIQTGAEKAQLLITLGDIYYTQKRYLKAQPCYQNAANLIKTEHPDYSRVSLMSETLGEIATNYNIVVLQDSLQYLYTLTTVEQMKIIDKIIKEVIAEEKREAEAAKEAENKGFVAPSRTDPSMTPLGAMGSKDWYFYNPQLKSSGAALFQKKWGKRTLEDNWRRVNKVSSMFGEENEANQNPNDSTNSNGSANGDTKGENDKENVTPETHKPEYYLAQIPKDSKDIEASNKLIADALYKMAEVYDKGLNDYTTSLNTYGDFQSRFVKESRILESYYACYQLCGKLNDTIGQERFKQLIITNFSDSKYAQILSQPNYLEKMQRMYAMQDSLYETTYQAYSRGDFGTVFANYEYMNSTYPLSSLMSKFAFLNALSIGKTQEEAIFQSELTALLEKFPQSEVAPMCKDIMALMNQGKEAQKGSTHGTILAKRDSIDNSAAIANDSSLIKGFTANKQAKHHLLLVPRDTSRIVLNQLLYDIAAYNFTKFLVKDFDITQRIVAGKSCIAISQLESKAEAEWYQQMLLSEPTLEGKVTLDKIERIIISDENLERIKHPEQWEEYIEYIKPTAKK